MATPAAVLSILVNAQTRQAQTELRRMDRTVGDSARNATKATREVDKLQAGVRQLGDQSQRSTRGLGLLKRSISDTVVGFRDLDRGVSKTNQSFTLFRNAVATLKWPAIIAGAGAAAQALAAAGAAAAALVGALAPLTGLLVAYPALLGAVGQALGVVSLAFKNVGEALGGNEEAMKRLTDQQRAFVKEIKGLRPELNALKDAAGADLFAGLTRGLRDAIQNLPILRGVARRTGAAIGDLAVQAGKLVGSKGFGRDFQTVGNLNIRVISRLGEGAINLGNALRQVVVAAGPFIDWLSRTVLGFTQSAESAAKLGRESGSLGRFFQSTREVLRVVAPMAWDFGQALLNIARAGRPLGMDILRSLREGAEAFREWTESAAGQNALRDYFARARPTIFEVGRLIRDVTEAFFRLGAQPGFAKVVKQIRTELLPVVERVIATTNKALTPALVAFATAAARAFEPLIGAYGPVVLLIKGLTSLLNVIANLTQNSTFFASAMSNVFGLFAAFKLAKLLAIASGLRALRNALLGVTAAGGAAAGAGGAAAGGGILAGILKTFRGGAAAGGVLGGLTALFNKVKGGLGRAGAIGLGITVGSAVLSGIQQRIRDRGRQTLQEALEQVSRQAEGGGIGGKIIESVFGKTDVSKRAEEVSDAIRRIGKSARGIDSSKAEELRGEIRKLSGVSDTAKSSLVGFVNRAEKRMEDLSVRFRKTGRVSDQFAANIRGLRIRGSNDFEALVDNVVFGSRQILRIGGRNSKSTREEVSKQFRIARDRVREAMRDQIISVREGTDRLRELAAKELKLYGISAGRVNVVLAKGPSGEMRPHQRGGFIDEGRPTGDSVPALLEKDEYVLNRRAVKKVGKRTLDAINFGMAPRFQGGGFVRVPGDPDTTGGRDRVASSIAQEVGAFIRRFGIQVGYAYDPGGGHESPGHNVTGTALDIHPYTTGWPGVNRAVAAATAAGKTVYYDGRFGSINLPPHGEGHHAHIEWLTGGNVAAVFDGLRRVVLQGPPSVALEAGQGVLDRTRQAANAAIERAIIATSPGPESGAALTGSGDVERIFAEVSRKLSQSRVATLALGMAGYAESGMRDLSYGHSSSQGALQLLASTAAGLGVSPHDEAAIASLFYTRGFYGRGGANALAAQGLPAHLVAQGVQGSADATGSNYARQETAARGWMARYGLRKGGLVGMQAGGDLNRRWPRGSRDQIRFEDAAKLAEKAGLPGITYAQLAKGESSFMPGAVSPDGGFGLWQMTPRVQPPGIVKAWKRIGSYFNPWHNARMAKVLATRIPKGIAGTGHYYGDKYVTDRNKHYKGSLEGFLLGGLVGMQGGGATIVNQGVRGPAESLTGPGAGRGVLPAQQFYRTLRTIRKSEKPKIRSKALQGLLKRIKGIEVPRADRIAELQAKTSMFGEFADRASQLSFGLDPAEYQDLPIEGLRTLAAGQLAQMTDRQRGLVEFSGRSLETLDEDALRDLLDFPVWAKVGDKTQVEWLEAQLETMRVLRNALIRADELIVARRQAVMERIKEMQERLEKVAEHIRRAAKVRNILERTLERVENLSGRNAPKKAREIVAGLKGDIPDNIWRALHQAVGKDKPTVELRKELKEHHQQIGVQLRDDVRERNALQEHIIPALGIRRDALTEALTGGDGVRTSLDEIQGQVGEAVRTQIFDQLPELGVLGGNIFDAQMSLRELGVRRILPVPQPEIDDRRLERLELEAEIGRQAVQRLAVSEAQFKVLREFAFPPYGGSFAEGGVVPGPVGAPRTVIAHGGEAIGQPGDVTVNVNVAPGMEWLKRFISVEVDKSTRRDARIAGRRLPGQGGGI